MIAEVQFALYKQIEDAEVTIVVDLAVHFLHIPKKHARSLVVNLLSNALKFHPRERKLIVDISCCEKGDYTELRFPDNDIGIKEDD